jgi:predicted lipase
VVSHDLAQDLQFPEGRLEKIRENAFDGVSLYPQIIVRSHSEKQAIACVRAYYEKDKPGIEIVALALHGPDGKAIDGEPVSRDERAHQTYPDGLLHFTVICKTSYEWNQIQVGSNYLTFGASINGSELRQYSFDLEADYVRYSGW